MKKLFILFAILLNFAVLKAQSLNLEDLKTPDSPGFQILDIAPTSIEKPINPKALGATLLSLVNDNQAIPKNFAMEISPYWYFKDSKASVHRYLNIEATDQNGKIHSNSFAGILNKLSVSMASVYNDTVSGSLLAKTNYLSFGVRTNLFTYRKWEQNNKMKDALENFSNRVTLLKAETVSTDSLVALKRVLKTKNTELKGILATENDNNKKKIYLDLIELNANQISELDVQINTIRLKAPDLVLEAIKKDETLNSYLKELDALPLIQLDGAFAYSEAFADNTTANRTFNRSGTWINLAVNSAGLTAEKSKYNLAAIGLLKYISDNILTDDVNNVFERESAMDVGIKIDFTIKDFTLAYEHIERSYKGDNGKDSDRNVFVMQYKISDGLYFTGSYGKNFGEVNNLFTLFGINYGFGNTQLNPLNK